MTSAQVDRFCPRHGRSSRPIEIPGLRCDCASSRVKIYEELDSERSRQIAKHGQNSISYLDDHRALAVLVEEVGEVAQAIIDGGDVRGEMVQVAAVAVGWLERYERGGG